MHAHGMRLLLDIIEPQHQKEAYLQLVRSKHIDGIILSGPRVDDEALQALTDEGFPTVLMGQIPGKNYYCVDVDNLAASRMAVSHLIGLGHQRIACITNAPLTYTAAAERLRGYQNALKEANIPYDESLVRHGEFSLSSGYKQMYNLFEAGARFTAAFVASDEVAMGAMAAARENGLNIPRDLALVGFDDLPMAYYMDPPLTTVHLPAIDLARQAIDMLLQTLKGKHLAKKQRILETHLVVRQSCGTKPKGGMASAK
jgi:DNA-binding LacI/PurR family transcriptional regulator